MEEEKVFMDLIKKRRSIRKYTDRPVEKEKIIKMAEAARLAPSASNNQPWRFFAVSSPDRLEKVSEAAGMINRWTSSAPLIIAACSTGGKTVNSIGRLIKKIDYQLLDLGIAVEHMALAAACMGLSTCWIGWFDEKKVKEILDIPGGLKVVSLLTVGYAPKGFKPRQKKRLPLEEILFFK